ncbi:emerin homolog 1-like [Watersipora subatra]|uniref:emerin homolog 1-like n=1 Tax=Watersipora subatra TaxID=2589382 RepID=UPI00355C6B95
MDLSSFTDDEIRQKLTAFGVPVGPIVDSTRHVYLRKLQKLTGELSEEPSFEFEQNEDESEEEQPVQTTPPPRQRPMTAKVRASPPSAGDDGSNELRQRKQQKKLDVPITAEMTQSSSGGVLSFVVKLILFLIILVGVFYAFSIFNEETATGLLD